MVVAVPSAYRSGRITEPVVSAKIWIGSVRVPEAMTSAVRSYSFHERTKPNRNAPKRPVQISGRVTSRKVRGVEAPRSRAASSTLTS